MFEPSNVWEELCVLVIRVAINTLVIATILNAILM